MVRRVTVAIRQPVVILVLLVLLVLIAAQQIRSQRTTYRAQCAVPTGLVAEQTTSGCTEDRLA